MGPTSQPFQRARILSAQLRVLESWRDQLVGPLVMAEDGQGSMDVFLLWGEWFALHKNKTSMVNLTQKKREMGRIFVYCHFVYIICWCRQGYKWLLATHVHFYTHTHILACTCVFIMYVSMHAIEEVGIPTWGLMSIKREWNTWWRISLIHNLVWLVSVLDLQMTSSNLSMNCQPHACALFHWCFPSYVRCSKLPRRGISLSIWRIRHAGAPSSSQADFVALGQEPDWACRSQIGEGMQHVLVASLLPRTSFDRVEAELRGEQLKLICEAWRWRIVSGFS